MNGGRRWRRGAIVLLASALIGSLPAAAEAQKTDVVTLANGDRITGEVVKLDRGRLEFSTDDAGTLYLEWDKLVSVTAAMHVFDIMTADNRQYIGTLGPAPPRSLAVVGSTPEPETLAMVVVTHISAIGSNFWRKLDGSISSGFSYTRSSGVAQLNVNSTTTYYRPGFQVTLGGSYTATKNDDDGDEGNGVEDRDDRGSISGTYDRFLTTRWVLSGLGRLETNEGLGLTLRSEFGAGAGPRLVNTNRAQLWVGAGMMVNREKGIDVEATKNVEAVFYLQHSFYTYDSPKTQIDVDFSYLPSLNTFGRQRLQVDTTFSHELLKDFTISLNFYDSFDSQPPNAAFDSNDIGIVFSVGWTY